MCFSTIYRFSAIVVISASLPITPLDLPEQPALDFVLVAMAVVGLFLNRLNEIFTIKT